MMSRNDLVEIVVEVMAQSQKAILVSDSGKRGTAVWIPKSQLHGHFGPNYGFEKGEEITIEIPEWLAEDKGLI